jgi:hypothetical protein
LVVYCGSSFNSYRERSRRNSRLQSRFDQSPRYTVNSFDFSTGHIGKHANAVLSANRNCCSGPRDAYDLMTVEGTVWRIARVYRQTLAKAALHDLRKGPLYHARTRPQLSCRVWRTAVYNDALSCFARETRRRSDHPAAVLHYRDPQMRYIETGCRTVRVIGWRLWAELCRIDQSTVLTYPCAAAPASRSLTEPYWCKISPAANACLQTGICSGQKNICNPKKTGF